MSDPNDSQTRSTRRWWPILILFIGLPLVLCGGLVSWWVGRTAIAQGQLDTRTEALRLQGMPVDNESLASYHRQHTDDLHTQTWVKILDQFESPQFQQAARDLPIVGTGPDVPAPGEPWPEQDQVQSFLNANRSSIDALYRVTESDRPVRFPINFDSYDTLLPYAQGMRQAARVLALEHHVALHSADSAADFQALNSLLGTSIALRGEPILVSQLVSTAIHGMTLRAIKNSIEAGTLEAAQIDSLIKRLRIFEDFQTPWRFAIQGERAMALPIFEEPAKLSEMEALNKLGSRPIDALAYLDLIERVEALPADDLDTFVANGEKWSANFERKMQSAGPLQMMDTVLTSMTLPAIEAYANAVARQVMGNRITILALGIRAFSLEQGRLPENLQELTAVGLDPAVLRPLGDHPFGYRIEDGEAVLWGFAPPPSSGGLTSVPADPPPVDGDLNEENRLWVWRIPGP